ncbi:family 10 glycosylhydrolase [Candidatus Sumerlaeota bacterium]|nr:family 10 glycosylhydrolase [Candidatus Sumerlaeota bacterium]
MNKILQYGLALSCGLVAMDAAAAASPEYRAVWVSRFEWPSANQTSATANIDNIMDTIAKNNFNTVLFQVRGQCDVHYPSPYEPWTADYGWKDPGWDPTAYALKKAHEKGLEFHAYINTHVMTGARSVPPDDVLPKHVQFLHGVDAKGADSWVIHGKDGKPVTKTDGYVWMSPGHPDASAWTRKCIMHFIGKYPVDGIHFDRIRCPGPEFSHDPVSQARFEGEGNPDKLQWSEFMCRQITDDLRRIYGQAAMVRPSVKISAAPFGIMYKDETTQYQGSGTQATHQWFQDGFRWLQDGVVDFMVPQIYWKVGSSHPFEKLLADWLSHSGGERFVVAGSTVSRCASADLIAQEEETRKQHAAGWCVFSFRGMKKHWDAFKEHQFAEKAPIPEMPWKTNPTKGIITGYVKSGDGKPITDTRIVLENDPLKNAAGTAPYNHLSAGDGFFAILNVPVGSEHHLTFTKKGKKTAEKKDIVVKAGNVTQVNVVLSDRADK